VSLRASTGGNEIATAFAQFATHFDAGAEALDCAVGHQGGNESATLRWFHDLGFWVLLEPERIDNRYWCAFGVDDPHGQSLVSISCEINPAREGTDRRCAGLFVRSDNGTVYLAHSGRVGGGRLGIGKQTFLDYYGHDTLDIVTWPDLRTGNYIVIGALDDDDLRADVARFVHKVAEFKAEIGRAS
jgi:hypothetical protein